MSSTGRDTKREAEFLRAAARGEDEFVERVEARLRLGDELYGTFYQWIGIRKLLDELREEALDLAAWASLADEALDREVELDAERRDQIRAVLQSSARYGSQAYVTLSLARRSIGDRR